MSTIAIIEESQAVRELRDLHERAERSAQEIGEELLLWKERLPFGKFAEAYREAGWASSEIDYYLYKVLKPNKSVAELVTENIGNEVVTEKALPHIAHNSGNNEWYLCLIKPSLANFDLSPFCAMPRGKVTYSAPFSGSRWERFVIEFFK